MKLDLSKLQDANRMIWGIYGPSSAGKTTIAFSLCAKWPRDFVKNKRPIILDDVIYWQWDPDGALAVAPFKIKVKPAHLLNMPAIIAQYGFPRALRYASETATALAENPKIKVEIHDTVSTFDKFSLSYIEAHPKSDEKPDDTQTIFGRHLANHRFYSTETMVRPSRVSTIYLFHEKVIDEKRLEKATRAERAKAKAKRMSDVKVNIIPAITGSGGEFYTNAVSLELSVCATPIPGKPGRYNRALYPLTHEGRRAKSRFQHLLTDKMPCDLAQLRKRIQAACK